MAISPGPDITAFPIETADAATNAADIRTAIGANNATNLSSGTVAVARGGTGATTSAGAAAAMVNGNPINPSTIGATTPGTASFTTLAASGATTLTAGIASTTTASGTLVVTGGLGVSQQITATDIQINTGEFNLANGQARITYGGATGKIRFTNNGRNGLSSIQLGTGTSASPELRVSGTTITTGLADGTSGGAFVASGTLAVTGATTFTGLATANGGISLSTDCILSRDAAATLQMGDDNATTPTAQTIKAHDVTTGTGASLTLAGGKGSAAGGALILATSATNGAPVARLTINAGGAITAATQFLVSAGVTYNAYTVATFPTIERLLAVVTDAQAPVAGAAAVPGGLAKALVMYSGTTKTVISPLP